MKGMVVSVCACVCLYFSFYFRSLLWLFADVQYNAAVKTQNDWLLLSCRHRRIADLDLIERLQICVRNQCVLETWLKKVSTIKFAVLLGFEPRKKFVFPENGLIGCWCLGVFFLTLLVRIFRRSIFHQIFLVCSCLGCQICFYFFVFSILDSEFYFIS